MLAGATLVSGWSWIPAAGLNASFRLDGLGVAVRAADPRHRRCWSSCTPRYYLRRERSGGALLRAPAALHGRDARRGARRQPAAAGRVLGADQPRVVPADRLLAATARTRAQGARMALHGHRRRRARAARPACCCSATIAGSFELDDVLAARRPSIRAHPLYLPMLVLVLLGAFTKSAQFPFHFWLPHAMAAPTPVRPTCTRRRW